MKIKREYILLTVVIITLAGYLVLKKTNRLHYTLPATPVIAKNDIMKLELLRGKELMTTLTKKDGTWLISPGEFQADTAKIDMLLNDIKNLTINTLVSESGDYLRYDLTEDKRVGVKVYGKTSPLFSFAVGKRAATFKHTFVMIDGDKRVFQSQGNFRNDFEQGPQDLRDKTVLPFAKDTLKSIEITENGKTLKLKKKVKEDKGVEQKTAAAQTATAADWVDGAGREIPEPAMNELFSQLTGLQCESYLDGKKKEDFKDPAISIDLQGEKGINLSIFTKNDQKNTGYPAVSSAKNSPFILQKFKVELLRKALKEIREENHEQQAGPAGTVLLKDTEPKK